MLKSIFEISAFNKAALNIAIGVMITGLFGYFTYSKKKQWNNLDSKKKCITRETQTNTLSTFPILRAVENYFYRELQLGELKIFHDEFNDGVQHLANAIGICTRPEILLKILRTRLPPKAYAMLLQKVQNKPAIVEKDAAASISTMTEDELSYDIENISSSILIDPSEM